MRKGQKISEGIVKKLKEKGLPKSMYESTYEINYYLYYMSDDEFENLLK